MRTQLTVALLAWATTAWAQTSADEAAIRAARAGSNRAIAAHDAMAVSRIFLPDYVSVSSTNVRSVGLDSGRARYAELFKARPDVVFVRTADAITVYREWGHAAESGHWTGRWTQPDGKTAVGGVYFAKWRKVGDQWMLLAEVFVQTSCAGSSYCRQSP